MKTNGPIATQRAWKDWLTHASNEAQKTRIRLTSLSTLLFPLLLLPVAPAVLRLLILAFPLLSPQLLPQLRCILALIHCPHGTKGRRSKRWTTFVTSTTDKVNSQLVQPEDRSLPSIRTVRPGSSSPCIRDCYLCATAWLLLHLHLIVGEYEI
jgi:hypothetical protein